ncbi:toll-like receptor 3 [Lineus longissimus]|uniref:toll-like receptor 3 n=1 Tax=Lineus longissimus TaxID=88925 RepID=UPI00315D8A54
MSAAYTFLLAAALLALLPPSSSSGSQCDCPQNCICNNSKSVICSNLKTFPKLCNGTQFVTIRNSAISTLNENDNLPISVRHLIVQRSQTKSIDEGFFPKGSELTLLSLDNNDIAKADWFKNIPHLANLDLGANHLSKLEVPSIIHLTDLKLNGNKIPHLDVSSALCKMDRSRLCNLHLDGMDLTAFPQGIIGCSDKTKKALQVTFLSLSKNKIKVIPRMTSLKVKKLYFSSNRIKDIPDGTFPQSLTLLIVANNPLGYKGLTVVARLTNLKHLDLSGINYKYFPLDMFHSLTKLEFLSLMKCNITKIQAPMLKNLADLKSLNLQSNHLKYIPVDVWSPLKNIENVFLDHNEISHILQTDEMEIFLFHLKKLGISNNPFSCTCTIVWFSKWMRSLYRTTEILSTQKMNCTSPAHYKGYPLAEFILPNCDKEKSDLEITLATVAIIVLVAFIVGIMVCCCRQGSHESQSKSTILNRGGRYYEAI